MRPLPRPSDGLLRALVIGADGFAGRWLVRHLVESGDSVAAGVGSRFKPPLEGADTVIPLDVRDAAGVSEAVATTGPEVVYDLAGVSSRSDREDVDAAIGVSVVGAANIMAACARVDPPPRLLFVSTGYVYRPTGEPLAEDGPLAPNSLYAAAKLAAERALTALAPVTGVDVLLVRPFNHIGPGQADGFVVPTLARQVADIAAGARDHAVVQDAFATRDFSDVRDVVSAYRLIARDGTGGDVYNVASGQGTPVAVLAALLGSAAGTQIGEVVSEAAVRDSGPVLLGDSARVRALGWSPRYPLSQTLSDVIAPLLAG